MLVATSIQGRMPLRDGTTLTTRHQVYRIGNDGTARSRGKGRRGYGHG